MPSLSHLNYSLLQIGAIICRLGVAIPFCQYRLEILWQAEGKLLVLACLGVFEAEQSRVQGVARHSLEAVLDKLLILGEGCTLQYLVTAIALIIEERMADILHMNTNLVCSARLEATLHQGHIAIALEHLVVRHCVLTLRAIGKDIHLVAIARIATDMARDSSLIFCQVTPHERTIAALRGVEEELVREVLTRLLVLADNKDARGVLVDTMHQAGTLVALLEHRVVLEVEGEGIDQGAAIVAVTRVNAHTRLLVHHDDIVILVHNVDGFTSI